LVASLPVTRTRTILVALVSLSCIVLSCTKDDADGPVDRVWYTADSKTARPPCLAKEDARVPGFLEKTWGKSGSRCVKRIEYGPEENDKDGNGQPAFATTCLYGVIWKDC
jgi:hypothetical protein